MTEFSVVSWNLHQAVDKRPANIARTWEYIASDIRPSIALIQEAHVIPSTAGGFLASKAHAGYSTAVVGFTEPIAPLSEVVTRYSGRHKFRIEPSVPGTFAAAQLQRPVDDVPLVAISLYGLMAPIYAQVGILRAIADLIPLFDTPALSRHVIVGGDMNVYDQSLDRVERARWRAILPVIESLGLVNLLKYTQADRGPLPDCPCEEADCWHVETFRHRNRRSEVAGYYTADYLFATPALAQRLTRPLEVWNRAEVWEMSDHCPLVARFDM